MTSRFFGPVESLKVERIVDESTNINPASAGFVWLARRQLCDGLYVLFIQGDTEFAPPALPERARWRASLNSDARPFGVSQAPDELRIRLEIETFGN